MKKRLLLIGTAAAATLFVGGWALAQSHGPGFGPPFMQGETHGGMGPGMMTQHMGRGIGPGMMQHGGTGMGPGMMHGGPDQMLADPTQIDKLKSELGITPVQESAWTKYATALQDAATTMKTTREGVDPGTVSKLNPADRFAFVSKIREQAQKQFETVQTAADELFATLDDTQKAKAQTTLPGLAFGPGTMHSAGVGGAPFRH
jgi:hypothetical protein